MSDEARGKRWHSIREIDNDNNLFLVSRPPAAAAAAAAQVGPGRPQSAKSQPERLSISVAAVVVAAAANSIIRFASEEPRGDLLCERASLIGGESAGIRRASCGRVISI